MKKVIHNIRSRPDHHKDKIIWISAAVAIGILLLIWAIVGNGRKATIDSEFFKTFGENIEAGRNVVPEDPLAQ